MKTFERLTVNISDSGQVSRTIETTNLKDFHQNEVLIRVAYSSLNYKDALSAAGNKGISRHYPHTPGIDASGVVENSRHPDFKAGDKVIVTGFDLGMNTKGGLSEYISVPGDWIIPLPKDLSLKEAMILGTAGLTAAMSIDKISNSDLGKQPVIVSGATGGVGSLAIMILNKIGVKTVALSRKTEAFDYLKSIGADEVIHQLDYSERPLLKGLYAGGIDVVGGEVLETMIKHINRNGSLAVCGLALSPNFNTTVYPFILRGLSLHGIESAEAPMEWRKELWSKLAGPWKPEKLEEISRVVILETLEDEIIKMLAGQAIGRVVIDLN